MTAKRHKILIFLLAAASLRCASVPASSSSVTTAEDFQRVETLLEINRKTGPLFSAARENGTEQLRKFVDEAGHRSFQRTQALAAWKKGAGATSRPEPSLPPCIAEAVSAANPPAESEEIARRLYAYRQCAQAYAREVERVTRDSDLRHIAEDFAKEFASEAEQLRKMFTD